MTRRYPGGIISAKTKQTNTISAAGIFDLPYQLQAINSGKWPYLGAPYDPFLSATNYRSLIDAFAGTIYYISPTGSDSNSGLAINSPLQTYGQFYTLTSTNTDPIMCVFLAGEHTIQSTSISTSCECAIYDNGKARTFVCVPGETTLNWSANLGRRDAPIFGFVNASSEFYGGIIKRDNNGRTTNYTVALFNNSTATFIGKVYNTVFSEVNANGNWSFNYANGGFPTGTQVNFCTFYMTENATNSYSGAGLEVNYSCSNYTYGTSGSTFTGWVTDSAMDATTYAITGNAGVYLGTYAWPAP